jgi:hypothetical protein
VVEEVMVALDDAMNRRSAELDNTIIDEAIDQRNGLPQVITRGG